MALSCLCVVAVWWYFIFPAGSLAVSVTDLTAPVVGSSGGVYALVSAHLANVVMVSCVCVCMWMIITSLSSCQITLTHHQRRLFGDSAGAALSTDAIHSSPSPSVCAHIYVRRTYKEASVATHSTSTST